MSSGAVGSFFCGSVIESIFTRTCDFGEGNNSVYSEDRTKNKITDCEEEAKLVMPGRYIGHCKLRD